MGTDGESDRASCSAVDTLVRRFAGSGGVADALIAKVESICAAPNTNAKAGKLGAFDNAVSAQTGKSLNAADAELLQRLAAAL